MSVIEYARDDQVIAVRAEMTLAELQTVLLAGGQCLPYEPVACVPTLGLSLRELLDGNLPHHLEAQSGSWRDWTLGLTLERPDGAVAKIGSMAVKNVAGYDVQKLIIGARGRLGRVMEVILRTLPLGARPSAVAQVLRAGSPEWVQRVRRSDYEAAVAVNGIRLLETDPASQTLWGFGEPPTRFVHDWVRLPFAPEREEDPHPDLTARAMAIFGR